MKNNYRIEGDITYIECTFEGKTVESKIDTSLLAAANEFPLKWYVKRSSKNHFYVTGIMRNGDKQKVIYLHRLLLLCTDGKVVDHLNHDTLDNRMLNIREVTRQENSLNMKQRRGVTFRKDIQKWRARIFLSGKEYFLGHYATEKEALRARKIAEFNRGLKHGDDISGGVKCDAK